MSIFIAKRTSGEGWISFESDPYLTVTRQRIYQRCAPCLEDLLEQLTEGRPFIELKQAWTCFKIAVVLPDMEQCQRFLELFEARYPQEYVFGKFGTGSKNKPTRAVVFHMESVRRRDELLPMVKECAAALKPDTEVYVSRACANPYEYLLGPWQHWQRKMQLPGPERVSGTIRRLREILYDRTAN